MKTTVLTTENLEKFKKYEISRQELNKLTGGGHWVLRNGKWVWMDDEE